MKSEEIGVADVARLFNVSKDTIKRWGTIFGEFLSESASPSKGKSRIYTQSDIRVLAYIHDARDWDNDKEDKEYHDIFHGLNSQEHYNDRYSRLVHFNTPVFQDVPSEIDETWREGVLLGGMRDEFVNFAREYKLAGDVLVESALKSDEAYKLTYPVFYNYRHSIEMYLKTIVKPKRYTHSLKVLMKLLKEYNIQLTNHTQRLLDQFQQIDGESTALRYGEKLPTTEYWIDFNHLRVMMDALSDELEKAIKDTGT